VKLVTPRGLEPLLPA